MSEQDEFFTKKHDRLLAVAVWAKYLAWVVLVVFIVATVSAYIQRRSNFNLFSRFETGLALEFSEMLAKDPAYTVSLFVELLSITLRGFVYFLVLNGISLGLNMIIETDLNYREIKEQGGVE